MDLGLFEKSNRPSNDVEFPSKSPINRLKTLFFPTRCARGGHFSGTDPVFVSQGRWSMIPSGVCDLVYCGAGCLGLSRGGLDLGLFRKSNRPSGRGGLDLGPFRKSNRRSGRGGWTLDFKKERIQEEGGGVPQSDPRIRVTGPNPSRAAAPPAADTRPAQPAGCEPARRTAADATPRRHPRITTPRRG